MTPFFLSCDASVLVAELLHAPFRTLLRRGTLRLLVAEHHWDETLRVLATRIEAKVEHDALTDAAAAELLSSLAALPDEGVIDLVPRDLYAPHEDLARRRIPQDPDDWPAVAVAITFGVGILTNDKHFLGCGCATWTVETLQTELEEPAPVDDDDSPAAPPPWLTALAATTSLPEEWGWPVVLIRARRAWGGESSGNADQCSSCSLLLPPGYGGGPGERLPCPRCGGMTRSFSRSIVEMA